MVGKTNRGSRGGSQKHAGHLSADAPSVACLQHLKNLFGRVAERFVPHDVKLSATHFDPAPRHSSAQKRIESFRELVDVVRGVGRSSSSRAKPLRLAPSFVFFSAPALARRSTWGGLSRSTAAASVLVTCSGSGLLMEAENPRVANFRQGHPSETPVRHPASFAAKQFVSKPLISLARREGFEPTTPRFVVCGLSSAFQLSVRSSPCNHWDRCLDLSPDSSSIEGASPEENGVGAHPRN
jgi:hypothetical protein